MLSTVLSNTRACASHCNYRAEPETAKIEEQGKTIVEALLKMPAKPPAPPAAPAPPPPPAMKVPLKCF